MKNAFTITALLLLLSVPTMAQEDPKLYFAVHGGTSQPEAPDVFKSGWKDGTSIGGGIGYRFSPRLSIQGLVNYDRAELDADRLLGAAGLDPIDLQGINVSGGDASVLSLSAELKVSLSGDPDRVSPYVTLGGGVADVEVGDVTISTSILGFEFEETMEGLSETVPMATAGLGLDIPFGGRFGAYVEGHYQTNLTKGDATDFASFRAGIRIRR